jgi:Lipocalin-like domain
MTKLKNTCTILSTLIFGLNSCSKNDSTREQVASIEGKWQYSKTGTITNNEELLTDYQHTPGCTKDYIEILASNILKSHEFTNSDCQEVTKTGTWNRSNNTLVVTYPDEPNNNGEILELTNTTLKVKFLNSDLTDVEILTRIP